jgi:hypothetical protein
MIYVTMTAAVVLVEIMYFSNLPKFRKYISWQEWAQDRWDNLAVSFISGALLCMAFPETALIIERSFNLEFDYHEYPHFGGLIIGLSSTPIINWLKKRTKDQLESTK